MLELRPGCECGDKDLPPEATDALICSFKCTFCAECAEQIFAGLCPNCGGELVPRPRRPAAKLLHHPAPMTAVTTPAQEPGPRGLIALLGRA